MPSKADILANLRASVAAIERGEAEGTVGSAPATAEALSGAFPLRAGDATASADTTAPSGPSPVRADDAAVFVNATVPSGSFPARADDVTASADATAPPFVGATSRSPWGRRPTDAGMSRAFGRRASDSHPDDEELPAPVAPEKTADEAFRKILRWVSVRERSSAYVRDRLAKDDFPAEAVEEALARAVRMHAVDDRRYGDALIRMKLAAGKGLRAAEAEIAELGIDPASLDAWQEHAERGRDAEVERALAVLRRRPPRAKQARKAAFRKLVGQGYATDVASTAARRWSEES